MSKKGLSQTIAFDSIDHQINSLWIPRANVTRVQSATEWTASVHTLHMPKPNVARVQSA